ncbi:MAG: hypothetical protein AB7L09_13025 [Nitrospira sp.]
MRLDCRRLGIRFRSFTFRKDPTHPLTNTNQQQLTKINNLAGPFQLTVDLPEDVLMFGDDTALSIAHPQLGGQRAIEVHYLDNPCNSLAKAVSILFGKRGNRAPSMRFRAS